MDDPQEGGLLAAYAVPDYRPGCVFCAAPTRILYGKIVRKASAYMRALASKKRRDLRPAAQLLLYYLNRRFIQREPRVARELRIQPLLVVMPFVSNRGILAALVSVSVARVVVQRKPPVRAAVYV